VSVVFWPLTHSFGGAKKIGWGGEWSVAPPQADLGGGAKVPLAPPPRDPQKKIDFAPPPPQPIFLTPPKLWVRGQKTTLTAL